MDAIFDTSPLGAPPSAEALTDPLELYNRRPRDIAEAVLDEVDLHLRTTDALLQEFGIEPSNALPQEGRFFTPKENTALAGQVLGALSKNRRVMREVINPYSAKGAVKPTRRQVTLRSTYADDSTALWAA